MTVSVLTADEYQAGEYDAVLVRDRTVLCVRTEAGEADPPADDDVEGAVCRVVPLDRVVHVDADPAAFVPGTDVPDSFYGGARYALLDDAAFPEFGD